MSRDVAVVRGPARVGLWPLGRLARLLVVLGLGVLWPLAGRAEMTEFAPLNSGDSGFNRDASPGKGLYEENCAMCHEGAVERAPHRQFIEFMPPDSILRALNDGLMKQQAAALTPEQRQHVAEYLTGRRLADYKAPPGPPMCEGAARDFDLTRPPAQVGWGYEASRFTPASVARLKAKDLPRLRVKWAYAFPGALRARSQPVVAMGAIFVGSHDGTVYAFDQKTGCARWTTRVSAEVRTAIVVEPWAKGRKPPRNPRLFFGDILGRAYAADALTGKILWQTRADPHPAATITGSPLLHRDRIVFPISSLEVATLADPNRECCVFRGSIVALDIDTGAERWRHFAIEKPATEQGRTAVGTRIFGPNGAPVWTAPSYDARHNLIYHGSGENYTMPADENSDAVFAVDADTGKRVWRFQTSQGDAWNVACFFAGHPSCPQPMGPDHDLSAAPVVVDLGGGKRVLVGAAKSGEAFGLDPDQNGKLLWRTRVGRGGNQGGVHFSITAIGRTVYVPINDMMLASDGTTEKDPGHPGLFALDAAMGAFVWKAPAPNLCKPEETGCHAGISAAITAMPGVVFAGHLDGRLRAYDAKTGAVLWETDTRTPVAAVNGQGMEAKGGSMSGPGPVLVDGMLITNSGYGYAWHVPGNALLVYTVDGK